MSALPVLCAFVLVTASVVPILFWGNPYPTRIFPYWIVGTGVALGIAALAFAVPALRLAKPIEEAAASVTKLSRGRFVFAVGCLAFLLGAFFAVVVFKTGPSTSDEVAQLWHAKILLTGRLSLPVDVNREFFALDTVVDDERWYSQFPIGGPLLLALGRLIGAPWVVNPLLIGIATVAMYHFGRRAYGENAARGIAIVFATAPSIAIMSGTMMNHTPTLCLVALTLALLAEWTHRNGTRDQLALAACIGLLIGLAAAFRPLDAVVVAAVVGGFQLLAMLKEPRRWYSWIPQVIGGTIGAAPVLVANAATTGNALRFAYEQNWGAGHGLGFHTDPYGNPFTPTMGLEHMITYVSELNMFVTAWPVPAVLLVVVSLLLLRTATKWDNLLLALFFVQLLVHGAYWGTGEFLGPRFVFTALPMLVVFIARLPQALAARIPQRMRSANTVFFAMLFAITWMVPQLSLNAWGLARIARDARKNLRIDVTEVTRSAGVHRALVFLREPFSARLTRELWGAGISRSETAQLLRQKDACALYDAVTANDSGPETRVKSIRSSAAFIAGEKSMESTDGVLSLSTPQSLTPSCKAEFDSDSLGMFVPLGVGLPYEPITDDGRIDGDIVYVADLGRSNERLRERFGDRNWYRLVGIPYTNGSLRAELRPYHQIPNDTTH